MGETPFEAFACEHHRHVEYLSVELTLVPCLGKGKQMILLAVQMLFPKATGHHQKVSKMNSPKI